MISKSAFTTETGFLRQLLAPHRRVASLVVLLSLVASVLDGISIGLLVPLLTHVLGASEAAELPFAFRSEG